MIKLYLIKLHSSRMFIELFLHILKSSKNWKNLTKKHIKKFLTMIEKQAWIEFH
jgi:hypothetical protein